MIEKQKDKVDAKSKNTTLTDSYARMAVYSTRLHRRGASLRLMAALLGTLNYSTIYGHLIEHDKEMVRISRRRPPDWEVELLKKWAETFPTEKAAMDKMNISLRKWCSYHGIVNEDGIADISAMVDKLIGSMNYGKDIEELLAEDFPSIKAKKIYWSKEIDAELYYTLEEVWIKGKKSHIYTHKSLGIKVLSKSATKGYLIFAGRLRTEVRTRRMKILAEAEVINAENIALALSWVPEDVSRTRAVSNVLNRSSVHQDMKDKEAASVKRALAKMQG